jgi:hypothetical protein
MRGTKGILAIAIVAALAVAITTAGATAGASSGSAVAAKKKCKKKKQAESAKKKKCKKKKKAVPAVPLVRATLTWTEAGSDDADLDLFVFDASGQRNGNGNLAIPITSMSPDVHGTAGTETFTDLNFNTHRAFSFGVCYQVGGSVHAPFTITYVTSDGQSHTESRDPGSSFHYDFPADGVAIPSGYCPD